MKNIKTNALKRFGWETNEKTAKPSRHGTVLDNGILMMATKTLLCFSESLLTQAFLFNGADIVLGELLTARTTLNLIHQR